MNLRYYLVRCYVFCPLIFFFYSIFFGFLILHGKDINIKILPDQPDLKSLVFYSLKKKKLKSDVIAVLTSFSSCAQTVTLHPQLNMFNPPKLCRSAIGQTQMVLLVSQGPREEVGTKSLFFSQQETTTMTTSTATWIWLRSHLNWVRKHSHVGQYRLKQSHPNL